MERSTVDASVVVAWLLDERRPSWVDETIAGARGGRLALLAPSLIWLELGNRLTARAFDEGFALEAFIRIEVLGIEGVELARPLRLRALQLAHSHRLSMYDATYLAVAEASNTPLLTLDRRLKRAASALGLGHDGGPRQVSETPARYGGRPIDRASLAAIGAAIAEFRRQSAT